MSAVVEQGHQAAFRLPAASCGARPSWGRLAALLLAMHLLRHPERPVPHRRQLLPDHAAGDGGRHPGHRADAGDPDRRHRPLQRHDHGAVLGAHDRPRRQRSGMNPILAILVGMVVCVAFGLLNGWLVTAIGLPAFIVTLGTFNIAFALVRIYTTATITNLPDIAALLRQHLQRGRHGDHLRLGADGDPVHHRLVRPALDTAPAAPSTRSATTPRPPAWPASTPSRVLTGVYTMAGLTYGIAGAAAGGPHRRGRPERRRRPATSTASPPWCWAAPACWAAAARSWAR